MELSELARLLTRDVLEPAMFAESKIARRTVYVAMRDGTRLATDLYFPPVLPAPVIVRRTPYGRAQDKMRGVFLSFACRGYVVVSQDVRGTGDSEPDGWDYYLYEADDGIDCMNWIAAQDWAADFIAGCGGSYDAQTQWCMARHPRMSAIVPEVSGLGIAVNTGRLYMLLNAYARAVGKGAGKLPVPYDELERMLLTETLAGGYFNEALIAPSFADLCARTPDLQGLAPAQARRLLWRRYCAMSGSERASFVKTVRATANVTIDDVEALPAIFGQHIPHDAHTIPSNDQAALCGSLHASPLLITGWYDWGLNDALATWVKLRRHAPAHVRDTMRLIITPAAHNKPGYHEESDHHPELQHNHRLTNHVGLLLRWYDSVRENATALWPPVVYYLMGANEWRSAPDWPLPDARTVKFYLAPDGALLTSPPSARSTPDSYFYDPHDPTPTVGGSILSYVYPPGSVDVQRVQRRPDVLTYTTAPLDADLDVVGPLRAILYASSSAVDTDFVVRLSDVFPDGRAIQLQNGLLRARHREIGGEPTLLEPGRTYRFEIDIWATANRFKAGHRLRIDVSSADFPRFDRNTNLGGASGTPMTALQRVFHDPDRPSHVCVPVLR